MTHVYFSGNCTSAPFTAPVCCSVAGDDVGLRFAIDFLGTDLLSSFSNSFFSCDGAPVGVEGLDLAKSNAVPGVFGVLVAEPKDANAPEPRPNAEEPPAVGDDTACVLRGATVLKGLFLLEDMLPKRLGPGASRP